MGTNYEFSEQVIFDILPKVGDSEYRMQVVR